MLEPGDDRQVGRELPGYVHAGNAVFRPHVDDRAVVGAVADALAVGPGIVAAVSEVRVPVHLDIDFGQDRRHA